jgi:hypothetical protein
MIPTMIYAIKTDPGPPVARDLPVPRKSPVPIVPPTECELELYMGENHTNSYHGHLSRRQFPCQPILHDWAVKLVYPLYILSFEVQPFRLARYIMLFRHYAIFLQRSSPVSFILSAHCSIFMSQLLLPWHEHAINVPLS